MLAESWHPIVAYNTSEWIQRKELIYSIIFNYLQNMKPSTRLINTIVQNDNNLLFKVPDNQRKIQISAIVVSPTTYLHLPGDMIYLPESPCAFLSY